MFSAVSLERYPVGTPRQLIVFKLRAKQPSFQKFKA